MLNKKKTIDKIVPLYLEIIFLKIISVDGIFFDKWIFLVCCWDSLLMLYLKKKMSI